MKSKSVYGMRCHYIFTLRLFWHLYGYAQSTNVDRHIMSFMQL